MLKIWSLGRSAWTCLNYVWFWSILYLLSPSHPTIFTNSAPKQFHSSATRLPPDATSWFLSFHLHYPTLQLSFGWPWTWCTMVPFCCEARVPSVLVTLALGWSAWRLWKLPLLWRMLQMAKAALLRPRKSKLGQLGTLEQPVSNLGLWASKIRVNDMQLQADYARSTGWICAYINFTSTENRTFQHSTKMPPLSLQNGFPPISSVYCWILFYAQHTRRVPSKWEKHAVPTLLATRPAVHICKTNAIKLS